MTLSPSVSDEGRSLRITEKAQHVIVMAHSWRKSDIADLRLVQLLEPIARSFCFPLLAATLMADDVESELKFVFRQDVARSNPF